MKQAAFIIALFQFVSLYSQEIMPGGVKGAALWEITEVSKNGAGTWESNLPSDSDLKIPAEGSLRTINNNPALLFNAGTGKINSTLNLGKLSSFSMITVCQETDTLREKIIFSLENDTAAEMVMTNRTLANLDLYRYASYNEGFRLMPKIYTYIQTKPAEGSTVKRRLQLGRPPQRQQLPVSAFNGIIPEVILFDRVISPVERRKIESYLALKYGIPLDQELPASYLDSKGEVIWDAGKNASFNRNIAGLGRDDLSGLKQVVSESIMTPGLMKLGVAGQLNNGSFLVWGDNGRDLSFEEVSGIRRLQREWKISVVNFKNHSLLVETNELSLKEIIPLPEGEIYWMMVDRSGTGKYPIGRTDYYPSLPGASPPKTVRFSPVEFDPDDSGDDVFTLITAPSFFARSIVQSPSCLFPGSGELLCGICGGKSPFSLIITGVSGNDFYARAGGDDRDHVFKNLRQGPYLLRVTDAENRSYTEKIWVSNSNAWKPGLSLNYDLIEGGSISLDASKGMPAIGFFYSWTAPDGSVIKGDNITVDQPGVYLLSITDDDNCSSIHEIKIKETGNSVFKAVQLFPNPTRGNFMLRVSLNHKSDLDIMISELSGRIIKKTRLKNDDFYQYYDMISKPGLYIINLASSSEKKNMQLVVR